MQNLLFKSLLNHKQKLKHSYLLKYRKKVMIKIFNKNMKAYKSKSQYNPYPKQHNISKNKPKRNPHNKMKKKFLNRHTHNSIRPQQQMKKDTYQFQLRSHHKTTLHNSTTNPMNSLNNHSYTNNLKRIHHHKSMSTNVRTKFKNKTSGKITMNMSKIGVKFPPGSVQSIV